METVCSRCGEQNATGAQFCSACGAYLGWQQSPPAPGTPQGTTAPVRDGSSAEPWTAAMASSSGEAVPDERDPFEAAAVETDATVRVDGVPVTVSVNVANTSTVVDSYVVDVQDAPPWLEVRPGRTELLPATSGTVPAELRIVSPGLVPAQRLPVSLRVRNTTGRPAERDLAVWVTVPVVSAPVRLRAEPRLLRTRDRSPGVCTVVVDNSHSNRPARVRLTAVDPERVVRSTWLATELDVPPGGDATTEVRFEAPPPAPGEEVSRTITITATEGDSAVESTVTLTQSASRAAIDALALRLEPSVLRLAGRRRGHLTAVVDNRQGAEPVNLSLRGHDPERSLTFGLSPAKLHVQPGREASAQVTVTAPRTPPGQEVTRPLRILASDGRTDVHVDGSVIQLASSRRGPARVLLTVLGGLLMILGALLPFVADTDSSAVQLTVAEISREIDASHPEYGIPDQLNAGGVENVVSVGLVLVVLAGLVVFGLTGRSGRLTRVSALLGAVVVVATFVGSTTLADGSGPASGALLCLVGCITAYAGGLLARR